MKTKLFALAFIFLSTSWNINLFAQLPPEKPLWPNGIPNNPVKYSHEKVRDTDPSKSSPSQQNRVFSCVSTPTYTIFKATKPNGVGLVICPGGGFRDVWIDREGNDFALWLAERGVTSLVLKYRTFNKDVDNSTLTRSEYNPEVYADAKQAIYILRSQADKLEIDSHKIGISGFSAGGELSLMAGLSLFEEELPPYADFGKVSTVANFLCLVYPGITREILAAVKTLEKLPPAFMINGAQDTTTPAPLCIDLYSIFLEKGIPAELHVYAKGEHGFDSGIGKGYGIAGWRDSFVDWLKDMKFIEE